MLFSRKSTHMDNETKKLMRQLAWRSFLIPLLYASLTYGALLGMTLLAKAKPFVIDALYTLGIGLFLGIVLLWVVLRKLWMKALLNSDIKELSRKAAEKAQESIDLQMNSRRPPYDTIVQLRKESFAYEKKEDTLRELLKLL